MWGTDASTCKAGDHWSYSKWGLAGQWLSPAPVSSNHLWIEKPQKRGIYHQHQRLRADGVLQCRWWLVSGEFLRGKFSAPLPSRSTNWSSQLFSSSIASAIIVCQQYALRWRAVGFQKSSVKFDWQTSDKTTDGRCRRVVLLSLSSFPPAASACCFFSAQSGWWLCSPVPVIAILQQLSRLLPHPLHSSSWPSPGIPAKVTFFCVLHLDQLILLNTWSMSSFMTGLTK